MSGLTPRLVFRNNLNDLGLLEASTGIRLTHSAQAVALVLENRVDARLNKDQMHVRIARTQLASALRVTTKTVQRALQEAPERIREARELERIQRWSRASDSRWDAA